MKQTDLKTLLEAYGLKPKKKFGQHFLSDLRVVEDIASACVADLKDPFVVEFGAGTGVLTSALLRLGATVVAVERDRDLLPLLNQHFEDEIGSGQLKLIEGDAKTIDLKSIVLEGAPNATQVVLAGNLPYQITGLLLKRAVKESALFCRAVFMIQKEVAVRLLSKPGSKEYGALSIFVQAAFEPKYLRSVPPQSFLPAPKVMSSVISLHKREAVLAEETPLFQSLVHHAFLMRRKKLRNSWRGIADVETLVWAAKEALVSLDARGETLHVLDFDRMARALSFRCGRSSDDV